MPYLLLVSLIWASSFSLIKTYLTSVPPDQLNALRLLLALLVFLPLLNLRLAGRRRALTLAGIGALQFGAMYFFYTRSFGTLKAHEAALATAMTPLYVTLVDDLLERRFSLAYLACALLAASGTLVSLGVFELAPVDGGSARGLLLIQLSNLCFAVGQVLYRREIKRGPPLSNLRAFAWCALGGSAFSAVASLPVLADKGLPTLTGTQWSVLLWLGVVASGVGFFLWNLGATRSNAGVLAVMNDLKIPLAMLVAVVVFGEQAAWGRLFIGCAAIAVALLLATRVKETAHQDVGL